MNTKTALITTMIVASVFAYAIQIYDETKSYEENIRIQTETDPRMKAYKNLNEYWFTDLSKGVCYSSTNKIDYTKLSLNNDIEAVTNMFCELNYVYSIRKSGNENPYVYTTHIVPYDKKRHVKRLQNELFDMGAIPVLASNVWVNGAVLATNNFAVSNGIYENLLMLNWYEQNENPLHLEMFGTNAVKTASSINILSSHHIVYLNGYRVKFDRRFNLWRLTEKLD